MENGYCKIRKMGLINWKYRKRGARFGRKVSPFENRKKKPRGARTALFVSEKISYQGTFKIGDQSPIISPTSRRLYLGR